MASRIQEYICAAQSADFDADDPIVFVAHDTLI
jgi:hypothetical protein